MIVVFIDGLCEPRNPGGIAAYGFVVYKNGEKLKEGRGVAAEGPCASNNLAEYAALVAALEFLTEAGLIEDAVEVRSDSRLLVNQMSGKWRVRSGLYLPMYRRAAELAARFPRISFVWIPREENVEADSLSRLAYEEYTAKRGGGGG